MSDVVFIMLAIIRNHEMRQISTYGDKRVLSSCTFCGGDTGTRDHCPSRVLLDSPYPTELMVVPSCSTCNTSFSADEEYLACLISCVIAGSTEPEMMPRTKTKRLLESKPALRAHLEQARKIEGSSIVFIPEYKRVEPVIRKLAKGHALYELHEICTGEPIEEWFLPLHVMTKDMRDNFEVSGFLSASLNGWTEVGSRAMQRIVEGTDITPNGWIEVQSERYRYRAELTDVIDIQILIHEYLACQVLWEY